MASQAHILPGERMLAHAFRIAYVAIAIACFYSPHVPAVMWTMLLPCFPLALVTFGFHAWRRVCPIAGLARPFAQGAGRGRMPGWLARAGLSASFVLLVLALALRLVATNGDAPLLGILLLALPAAAVIVNRRWSGRAWCHSLCPVAVVERIYTDGAPPRITHSRCTRCSGCIARCADIDAHRSYRHALRDGPRRFVTYAFPGLVLGFYGYYRLRAGTWSAYFDGGWTHVPASRETWLGPGFAAAPHVPAVIAVVITLVTAMAASALAFTVLEAWQRRPGTASEPLRHRMLVAASTLAFLAFYAFAGQPCFGRVPGLSVLVLVLGGVTALDMVLRRRSLSSSPSRPAAAGRRLPIV